MVVTMAAGLGLMVKIAFRAQGLALISSIAFVSGTSAQAPEQVQQRLEGGQLQGGYLLQRSNPLQTSNPLQGAAPIQSVGPLPDTNTVLLPSGPAAIVAAAPPPVGPENVGTLDELLAQLLGGPNPPDPQLLAMLVGKLTSPPVQTESPSPPQLASVAGLPPTYQPPSPFNPPVVLPPPSYEPPKQAQISPSQ
jgi:hypothetical protein